jgi:hypothetical protein
VTYEYRVFVEGPEEISVSHFSSEKLWEGATFRASKPGHDVDGKVLVVYRLVSHPTEHGPGIAHGRVSATEKEPWQ